MQTRGAGTCPEVEPIKAIGVEVIAHAVAAPALATPWVWAVALGEGPAHTQVRGLSCHKWGHLVHHHLKVPFAILRGALSAAHEYVGANAAGEMGKGEEMGERDHWTQDKQKAMVDNREDKESS